MAANDQRLIWLDMEMSGLDPRKSAFSRLP
ncbi:hypothetical protein CCAE64S_00254 [Castellaniella caeni]